jgi:thymidylate synthase ThyX
MAYAAKIIKDSFNPVTNNRLVTMEVTYPRMVHSELMTHKMMSKNAASSRAIPVQKMIDKVRKEPVFPVWWGKNQSGMQAKEELQGTALETAQELWLGARDHALESAQAMVDIGVHKQIVNRLLEPFSWITVIISATEWNNFFNLRCHPDAQPELRKIAEMMCGLYYTQAPEVVEPGGWHLPYINEEDKEEQVSFPENLRKISVARCARVSYLTHDGKRDHQEDLKLYDRLMQGSGGGHWSPFEHVAMAQHVKRRSGNFEGWDQFRKLFPQENQTSYVYQKAAQTQS